MCKQIYFLFFVHVLFCAFSNLHAQVVLKPDTDDTNSEIHRELTTEEGNTALTSAMVHDVLSRLSGDWNVTYNQPSPFSEGTLSGKWILGNKYLEQSCELKARSPSKDLKMRILTTYDYEAETFKQWYFLSNGLNFTSIGTWNAETETLTWVTEQVAPDSIRFSTTSIMAFRKNDTIEVTRISTNDAGREVGRETENRTRKQETN